LAKIVVNRGATISIIGCRVAYAINRYNGAAIFSFAASALRTNIARLRFLTASFFIGSGSFQIASGTLAAQFGPRKVAMLGTLTCSFAALMCELASSSAFVRWSGIALEVRKERAYPANDRAVLVHY
jgi:MFS family permease